MRIDHLPKGSVTVMNIYQLDPFGNDLVVTTLTGSEIRALMLSAWQIDDKSPVYPSGIRTRVRLSADGNMSDVTLLTDSGALLI
ncbi:MAG: 5'-nucleotidase C-terminal domain-containing protein [Bacteroidales bacterium]|nr:5'-nucleotidase C-terminal domain-containing protein [Bacteroidales bacterium]